MAYPTAAAPQTFAPKGFGGYGPSPPPPPPGGAREAVRNLAHSAGHSFVNSAGGAAGHALGTAAIGALLARVGGGAVLGAPGGPAGVLAGAAAGAAVAGAGEIAHGLINRGGAGGNSAPSPDVPGTISGFRPQGRNIDQSNIAAQQRAHTAGGSTAAFTGSTRTLNGLNEGFQPRDRQVRSRITRPAPNNAQSVSGDVLAATATPAVASAPT